MAIDICADHPSAFWNRKKHIMTLPYEDNFSKDDIPIKSRTCQMNTKLVEFCKMEIDSLLQKGLIKPSKSLGFVLHFMSIMQLKRNEGKVTPIQRLIDFSSKFPNIITDKMQLQRFLGSLNYISSFYKNLSRDLALLYDRLKKDHKAPWTDSVTNLVKNIKLRVKSLPCLTLANKPAWQKSIETDASIIGYEGILKQMNTHDKTEMEPPWITNGRGKGNNPRGRGRYSPSSSRSLYGSSSNTPIIQK
ncbi:hypothetical protein H5410_045520 [Solanum commersonii]|uniref:Reverse transcriptase/retrotransposon-derived protein RNase H-like domain-containing protein n=1 Tax=Solanum commersonii TaxID=4109 RepID=A0A9J5XCY9_SOLCO|nr:hypothetical protein H5410_045520 [Solanum commersonii]